MPKLNKSFKSLPADAFLEGATIKEAAENFTKKHRGLPQCKKRIQRKLVAEMTSGKPERQPIMLHGVLGFRRNPRAKQVYFDTPGESTARRIPQAQHAYV